MAQEVHTNCYLMPGHFSPIVSMQYDRKNQAKRALSKGAGPCYLSGPNLENLTRGAWDIQVVALIEVTGLIMWDSRLCAARTSFRWPFIEDSIELEYPCLPHVEV
jgi:hypothetical protein